MLAISCKHEGRSRAVALPFVFVRHVERLHLPAPFREDVEFLSRLHSITGAQDRFPVRGMALPSQERYACKMIRSTSLLR
jgi:hypothetical protein